jgi:hypothetical protein
MEDHETTCCGYSSDESDNIQAFEAKGSFTLTIEGQEAVITPMM